MAPDRAWQFGQGFVAAGSARVQIPSSPPETPEHSVQTAIAFCHFRRRSV